MAFKKTGKQVAGTRKCFTFKALILELIFNQLHNLFP